MDKFNGTEVNVDGKTGRGAPVIQLIKEYIYLPLSVLVALILGGVIFLFGIIPTGSMEPTYMAGSFFIGWRLADEGNYQRGDTVIFYHGDEIYVKRVVGLPGETISFADGNVYVDGELCDESAYLSESVKSHAAAGKAEFNVPEDSYFVMGDNRHHSYDARFWPDPFVSFEDVIAKPLLVVYVPFLDRG